MWIQGFTTATLFIRRLTAQHGNTIAQRLLKPLEVMGHVQAIHQGVTHLHRYRHAQPFRNLAVAAKHNFRHRIEWHLPTGMGKTGEGQPRDDGIMNQIVAIITGIKCATGLDTIQLLPGQRIELTEVRMVFKNSMDSPTLNGINVPD